MGSLCSQEAAPVPKKTSHLPGASTSTNETGRASWKKRIFIDTESVEVDYWRTKIAELQLPSDNSFEASDQSSGRS